MDEKYFVAKITTDMVDENTGKIKKLREEKLCYFEQSNPAPNVYEKTFACKQTI